jgi:hypothetical protein
MFVIQTSFFFFLHAHAYSIAMCTQLCYVAGICIFNQPFVTVRAFLILSGVAAALITVLPHLLNLCADASTDNESKHSPLDVGAGSPSPCPFIRRSNTASKEPHRHSTALRVFLLMFLCIGGVDGQTVATLAGTVAAVGTVNGVGSAARFNGPWGIAVDAAMTFAFVVSEMKKWGGCMDKL